LRLNQFTEKNLRGLDIVEVLLQDGKVREVRYLPNTFPLAEPYRYG
jgi:hypothetical protein